MGTILLIIIKKEVFFMHQMEHLGLKEARVGMDAVLAEIKPGVGACVIVVDGNGDLICGAKTDGAYPMIVDMAFNKAYAAARMLRDTLVMKDRQKEIGVSTFDWGNSKYTTVGGGVIFLLAR
jgi:uncharacterized protein GlcG (DUF336 family)